MKPKELEILVYELNKPVLATYIDDEYLKFAVRELANHVLELTKQHKKNKNTKLSKENKDIKPTAQSNKSCNCGQHNTSSQDVKFKPEFCCGKNYAHSHHVKRKVY